MADATDSKSVGSDTVWVQVPPSAPKKRTFLSKVRFYFNRQSKGALKFQRSLTFTILFTRENFNCFFNVFFHSLHCRIFNVV